MDSATHVAMGVGLCGLATLDPVIADNQATFAAAAVGIMLGSQAPDLDTVLKMRNNAVYIKNHRGSSHSLPAVLLWSVAIAVLTFMFIPEAALLHVWIWTLLAVGLHVFVDIFNAYGTKALAPFKNRWIALGAINIFDPFLFGMHILGIVLWIMGAHPGYTFLAIYGVLLIYYLWRMHVRNKIIRLARKRHPRASHIFISPTIRWSDFHLVIRTRNHLHVATYKNKNIRYLESFPFEPIPQDKVILAALKDTNLTAFLSFSPAYRWNVEEKSFGYEVTFTDLRYRSGGYYPFITIVRLNSNLQILGSYTGWIYNQSKLEYKLQKSTEQNTKKAKLRHAT
ncbi:membrane protein [Bacillaceae bacterium JMAK1]|nr:membrane protein [Bacillaceae bacterium JMAK1]